MQDFADDVFGAAYNITRDADRALAIFDDMITILNVDVNVSGMNTDIAVRFLCLTQNPADGQISCMA